MRDASWSLLIKDRARGRKRYPAEPLLSRPPRIPPPTRPDHGSHCNHVTSPPPAARSPARRTQGIRGRGRLVSAGLAPGSDRTEYATAPSGFLPLNCNFRVPLSMPPQGSARRGPSLPRGEVCSRSAGLCASLETRSITRCSEMTSAAPGAESAPGGGRHCVRREGGGPGQRVNDK